MALAFENLVSATIKAKDATSTDMFTIPGVTVGSTTPANAAEQINKLLAIGNKAVVADVNMKRVITQEAIDNE